MNDDQIKDLIGACKAARRAKKPFHFFYCEQAADEEPLLMVGKRIPPAEVKTVRRAAKTRKFCQGTVHSSGTGLVFQTPAAGRLEKHLKVFAKRVPPLKKARIVGMDEDIPPPTFVEDELEEAEGALGAAELQRRETIETGASVEEEVGLAEEAYQGRLEHLREARDQMKAAFKEANLSKQQFAQAKDGLPNLLQEIFNSSEENRVLAEKYREALAAMSLSEGERQRRLAVFVEQQAELPDSSEAALLSIRENVQRRTELAIAEKQLSVRDAERTVAQKKVNQATVAANRALDTLQGAIEAVPELKALSEEAEAQEALSDERTQRVLELQDEITDLQERLRVMTEALKASPDPDLIALANMRAVEMSLRSKEVLIDQLTDEAEAAEDAAKERRKRLKERAGALAATTPDLQAALEQQRTAREALKTLVEEEATADDALDDAEEASDEAARRLRIQPLMRQAQALIDANRYFYEDLKGVNPRDPESVEAHRALLDNGGRALFDRSRELYTELVVEGATKAELETLFAPVPGPWRPDALTEHMKWFQRLEAWEGAMGDADKAAKMQEEIERKLYGEDASLVDRAQEALEKVFEKTETIRGLLAKVGKKKEEDGGGSDAPTVASESAELAEDLGAFGRMKEGVDALRSSEGIVAMSEIVGLLNSGIELVGGVFDIRKAHKEATAPKVDPRLSGLLQGDAGYEQADDPLLQRMRDEKLLAAVAKLGEKGFEVFAEVAGELLPGLGLAVAGKDLIKAVVEAGSRIANSLLTGEVLDDAEAESSTAIEALKQAKARETQLAVKASVETAVGTLKAVGEIGKVVGLAAVGAGAAAGYAISISASALSIANSAGNAIVDFGLASKAKEFYEQARAGDAEGARKLFEYSRKHAKGMLAWMAKEGDNIAKKYVSIQGVTDEELDRTCPAVLQQFLLRAAKEEDAQKSFPDWLSEKVASVRSALTSIGSWAGASIIDPIGRLIEKLRASVTMPEIPGRVVVPAHLIQKLSEALTDFAQKRAFLEKGGRKNRRFITDLDAQRAILDREALAQRTQLSDSLALLSEHIQFVNGLLSNGRTARGEVLDSSFLSYLRDVLVWLKDSLKTDLNTMDMLADLA